ncbi:MAG: VOC family protein [Chloroflexi bacterium]|nr:VOC family protein [Chloroflexota bacterium]
MHPSQHMLDVQFDVNGQPYRGSVPATKIVHQALEQLLPHRLLHASRITIRAPGGALVYPDMFLGEIADFYGGAHFQVEITPLGGTQKPWRNVGFDHLALAVTDRDAAREFFSRGLQMQVVRDDAHLTVVTTGNTALFLFNADPSEPMSDGIPSKIHHIGFVVDDLEAAYNHLRREFPEFASDYTLLEREERLSLYGKYTIGTVIFMIQLSQVKPEYRGFPDPHAFADLMYNYASKDYGVRLG